MCFEPRESVDGDREVHQRKAMKQKHFKYGNTSIIELDLCSLFSKRACSSCSAHISIYLFPWYLWTLGCFPRFVRVRNWDPFIGLAGLWSRAPGAPESREWEDPQPSFTEENPIKWEDPHCGLWVPKPPFCRRNSYQMRRPTLWVGGPTTPFTEEIPIKWEDPHCELGVPQPSFTE